MKIFKTLKILALATVLCLGMVGCSTPQSCIIVTNQTGIGISVKENPQTQMYEVWLGYINSVFGIVPTNRAFTTGEAQNEIAKVGGGAKDTGNVLFETNFSNWFKFWSDQGIYQRVAIGDTAVIQPGAVVMFAKNNNGTLNEKAIEAVKALTTSTPTKSNLKLQIVELAKDPAKKAQIVEKLKVKNLTWDQFIDDNKMTETELQEIITGVK